MKSDLIIAVKGAGDLASGIALRLWRSGFRVILSELPTPLCIRRTIAFCGAVVTGTARVEDAESVLIRHADEAEAVWQSRRIPLLIDPDASEMLKLQPDVLIDARIIKDYRTDTHTSDAPLVIGLGPGFTAGENCHCVIETNRGHNLGRVLWSGSAEPNTGVPGTIQGEGKKRVLHSPCDGTFSPCCEIGDTVRVGEVIARVNGEPVVSQLDGIVRGIIMPGLQVSRGLKIMDVDPRGNRDHCFTVSDKATALGGAVLEAVLGKYNKS